MSAMLTEGTCPSPPRRAQETLLPPPAHHTPSCSGDSMQRATQHEGRPASCPLRDTPWGAQPCPRKEAPRGSRCVSGSPPWAGLRPGTVNHLSPTCTSHWLRDRAWAVEGDGMAVLAAEGQHHTRASRRRTDGHSAGCVGARSVLTPPLWGWDCAPPRSACGVRRRRAPAMWQGSGRVRPGALLRAVLPPKQKR